MLHSKLRSHLLSLVFLLVHADFTYSEVHYITPSLDDPCPQNSSCLTLSQFAANSSYNEKDISILFLQGNHTLSRELFLSQLNNFSMAKDGLDNDTVFVECSSRSGRFLISESIYVSIKDLHFIGCGSNRISLVEWLTIADSTFQGVTNSSIVLLLNEISNTSIVRTSFLSNTLDFNIIYQLLSKSEEQIVDYVYLQQNASRGVLYTALSNVSIINCKFMDNRADIGGAMVAHNSSLYLARSTYSNNTANFGGVMVTSGSTIDIDDTTFMNNVAHHSGGVMVTNNDVFTISSTTFMNNSADTYRRVMLTSGVSSFSITLYTTFSGNTVTNRGGVMATCGDSSFNIRNTTFSNNRAYRGGVMYTSGDSSFNIINTTFTNNNATFGGVIYTDGDSSCNIINSTFSKNSASVSGGDIYKSSDSSFNIINSTLTNNKASYGGGVIFCLGGTLNVDNSNFSLNSVDHQGGGLFFIYLCPTHITNCTFDQNNGSLYIFNGNLTISGYLKFENGMKPFLANTVTTRQEGGAITSFQSTVTVTRKSTVLFSNNRASHGGAILVTESTFIMYGETTIANSNITTMTNSRGGGISLRQSTLEIRGNLTILNNSAVRGGGIHATGSTITVFEPATLQVINNSAKLGGGIYLEVNPKLYILKNIILWTTASHFFMNFTGNHANYGGAVYVADDMNSGACSPDIECFIQTLALYQKLYFNVNIKTILFSKNTASEQGSNIFGGLLDRCIPSPFAEVYLKQDIYYSGVTYLGNISNIKLDSINSQPVRVCFCNSKHEPDCSYKPPAIRVEKGKAFNVYLVAVDQVNHTVSANIVSSLSSSDGGFGEGQQTQSVERNCTNLTFNVFSRNDFETISFYPNGPCGSVALSTSHATVQFINCTCPVGFQSLSNSQPPTRCECDCDSALSPYITDCNVTTSSVLRKGTNSWITYINDTNPPGFVTYPNCPFDYCQLQTENVIINFNLPKGADSQCAFNRTGVLCGACKDNLSISLASSRCVHCHTHWPAKFVVILLAAAIAGILLVTALLALNMTVSGGLINIFIFYANIVSAGSAVFFPSSEPNFPSVFVAWLNLDIGIDACFIDGLDAYTKTWLQLAFPVYIISLVVMVIIVSDHSPRFAGLIGKRDPISTLATLILLSYAKLLSITITALSYAILHYPDGKQATVWLPDGNVLYFQGKHIPLALVALLIVIIGLPYTILLFLWQWIVRAPRWKFFKWTRNTKLNAFITSHHVPHNSKYRYWTGLLLLVRVVLYITASVTISANPQTLPLILGILIGGLILFKGVYVLRVYKNYLVDVVDTLLYFNLLTLSLFSLYDFKANFTKQTAVAYATTIITFIIFIVMICYHVSLLIKKEKTLEDWNEDLLATVQPANAAAEVTHSVIELPKPDEDPPRPDSDSDEQEIIEDRRIITPPYNDKY